MKVRKWEHKTKWGRWDRVRQILGTSQSFTHFSMKVTMATKWVWVSLSGTTNQISSLLIFNSSYYISFIYLSIWNHYNPFLNWLATPLYSTFILTQITVLPFMLPPNLKFYTSLFKLWYIIIISLGFTIVDTY